MDLARRRGHHFAMDTGSYVSMACVFLVAGAVKGVTGMGLPTVAVSLLGLWMAPAQAAALLVWPSLATNVAQCRGPHLLTLVRRLWPVWIAMALVTACAPALPDGSSWAKPHALLGVVLMAYGLWGLWRPALPDLSASPRWLGPCVGGLTGAVTAATAVFVFPLVPYLQALRQQKNELVQALGLSFTVATLALATRLQWCAERAATAQDVATALAAAFAGLWLGARLRARISASIFQRALFFVFVGLGVANFARGA